MLTPLPRNYRTDTVDELVEELDDPAEDYAEDFDGADAGEPAKATGQTYDTRAAVGGEEAPKAEHADAASAEEVAASGDGADGQAAADEEVRPVRETQ